MSKPSLKLWGTTQTIFAGMAAELHRIEVVAGGFCSIHRHRTKSNLFFVESGKLRIRLFAEGKLDCEATDLAAGESLTVPAGVLHQFEAIEPTVAYEHYSVDLAIDPADITRFSEGGVKPCEK